MTLQQYRDECVHMLNRQPGDYHIGARQRAIIAECHKNNRPITSAVGYIMRNDPALDRFIYRSNNS